MTKVNSYESHCEQNTKVMMRAAHTELHQFPSRSMPVANLHLYVRNRCPVVLVSGQKNKYDLGYSEGRFVSANSASHS